ncbi:MAG: acyltransferase family protein [Candidatus Avigastranaerophilus sp.]
MSDSRVTNKLDYITFLQSFAVTLVIVGHCLPKVNVGDIYPFWAKMLHSLVYSFYMPLFFVIGGFLLMHSFYKQSSSINNFKDFIVNKIKRLIIPYCSVGTVAYLLKIFVFNKFAYRPAEASIMYYIKSMIIPWNNPNIYLWFLPTMFLILLIGYVVLSKENHKSFSSIWILLIFIISFLSNYSHFEILNITGVLYYTFFFFIGILLYEFRTIMFHYFSNYGIILVVFLFFLEYFLLPEFQLNCFNYLLKYLVAISGIILSFSLALFCAENKKKFLYGLIDGKYYQIYLLSWFFQCGTRIFYQMHWVNYPTVCLIMFISSFIFPLLITYLIKRFVPIFKVCIGL